MSGILKVILELISSLFKVSAVRRASSTVEDVREKKDQPFTGFKIVIDPGHGGRNGRRDPGAAGKYVDEVIYERDIVLEICSSLAYQLDSLGFEVVMTRIDNDLQGLSTLASKTKIVRLENPHIFISVHANANSGSPAQGIETFYHKFRPESPVLAKYIQRSLIASFANHKNRGLKDGSRLYVLKSTHSVQPECLVECEFINHPDQAKFLVENPEEIAQAITDGIVNYMNK